jgi:hypothetical protein
MAAMKLYEDVLAQVRRPPRGKGGRAWHATGRAASARAPRGFAGLDLLSL